MSPRRSSSARTLLAAMLLAVGATGAAAQTPRAKTPPLDDTELLARGPRSANPYLSFLPAGVEPDHAYWRAWLRARSAERAARRPIAPATLGLAESEPNDTVATADAVDGFGTGEGDDPAADLTGSIAPAPAPGAGSTSEENGSIPDATVLALADGAAVTVSSAIGDGAYGAGSGDFDLYRVTTTSPSEILLVDVDTPEPYLDLDPYVTVYDSAGNVLGENDDGEEPSYDSFLILALGAPGDYYVSVGAFGSAALTDPFDPSSGPGAGSTGSYDVTIGRNWGDLDHFAVELDAGDVLGATLSGGAERVGVLEPGGELRVLSGQDPSGIYPPSSPLPGGGPTASFVARVPGTHHVLVLSGGGAYGAALRAFRPGPEGTAGQILFVDFDGATVNPAIFGGPPGSAVLSPLSAFLSRWGLGAGSEDAVIDAILATLEENLDADLTASGINPDSFVQILNSRDHADPFGQPGVSRLIVGGSIAELGRPTIGIAENIDPGNFEREASAVTLLDLLSTGPGPDFANSLNQYGLTGGATIIDLIGEGVGNITAHEAGHLLGSYHTDQRNATPNLEDQGGDLDNIVGVGPDRDLGSVDDVDVDFVIDAYVANEGFGGREDTQARTAFALTGPIFADGFESGNTLLWAAPTVR